MNLSAIIGQLRDAAPIFNGNVAGAAAYANGVEDQVWLGLPSAYVVPWESSASDNDSQNGLYQYVTRHFVVFVVIDNAEDEADRRGQAAVERLALIEPAIFKAILNWRPDPSRDYRSIFKVDDGLEYFDRARLIYKYTFGLVEIWTDADGWVLPSVPLVNVQGTIGIKRDAADVQFQVALPRPKPNRLLWWTQRHR